MKKTFILMVFMAFFGMINAQSHWTPITGTQYNMLVSGKIYIDGVVQNVTTLEVAAFCGDQCRSIGSCPQFFPPTQEYIIGSMVIVSNQYSGEDITFRIYDHAINEELDLDCVNHVTFEHNTEIGNIGSWFEFAFTTPTIHNTTSGSWSDPTIWNTIPDATSTVVIAADCIIDENVEVANLTVSDGVALTVGAGNTLTVTGDLVNGDEIGLVIEDGAQVVNESAGVKATVEKDVTAYSAKDTDGWYLISSSVNDMAISGSDFVTETYDLYRYHENGNNSVWENYRVGHADFTTFENGRGYLYANSNTFTPVFTGDLNYDDVVRPITCTGTEALSGFNVIGNPFPHIIYKGAGGAIDDNSLAAGYYTLTFKGEWESHTFDEPIMPEQGIMVKATTSKDLTITKETNAASSESMAKNDISRLKLTVSGEKGEDRAYVYFGEGIGLNKIEHLSDVSPMIYIANDGGDYAIAMLDEETERFGLSFKAKAVDRYTLNVNADGNFNYLHLIDKLTGEEVDLLIQNDYSFIGSPVDPEERFLVKSRDYSDVDELMENTTFAYVSNGDIVVSGEGTMQLIDMTGRVVETRGISGAETVCKPSSGVYIVRIVNGTNVKIQKIVVR